MSDVAFPCQDCGRRIVFPAERRGHVEVCPHCGAYVDVPWATEITAKAESESAASQSSQAEKSWFMQDAGTSNAMPWIEVIAVLCLAYLPYMLSAIAAVGGWWETGNSFVLYELNTIVCAFQVVMPLLVIMALGKDSWSAFGIVRPHWIADALIGCLIWLSSLMAHRIVMSMFLPLSLLADSHSQQFLYPSDPGGMLAGILVFAGCVCNGFAQEIVFRGYLIARLEHLLRSTAAAVVITSILFASYHIYQGVVPLIGAAAVGLVYALAFCLTRRLWPLCVAHIVHNFMCYLI